MATFTWQDSVIQIRKMSRREEMKRKNLIPCLHKLGWDWENTTLPCRTFPKALLFFWSPNIACRVFCQQKGMDKNGTFQSLVDKVGWTHAFSKTESTAGGGQLLGTEKIQDQLKATELLFLPTNATTKLQQVDQGIIRNNKAHHKTANLMNLITHVDGGKPAEDFHIILLEAVTMLKQAWDRVTPSTIRHCFRITGFVTTSSGSIPSSQSRDEDAGTEPLLFWLCT